jgi:hypothetical protein
VYSFVFAGLSKFAKLARSVTRSRSVLVSQFSSHLPNLKDTTKQSHLAHVSTIKLVIIFVALVYLMMLSVAQTVKHWMNNEFEWIWKEQSWPI